MTVVVPFSLIDHHCLPQGKHSIVPTVSTVIDHFHFFLIMLEYTSKCFVTRRRPNHSFLYADSGGILLMRSENQKIKLR